MNFDEDVAAYDEQLGRASETASDGRIIASKVHIFATKAAATKRLFHRLNLQDMVAQSQQYYIVQSANDDGRLSEMELLSLFNSGEFVLSLANQTLFANVTDFQVDDIESELSAYEVPSVLVDKDSGGSSWTAKKIAIAVGMGVAALLVLILLLWCCYKM